MPKRLLVAALAAMLPACTQNQLQSPDEVSTPTEIAGQLVGESLAGMPIYAGGHTPYADQLVYETAVQLDGTFGFQLQANPPKTTNECFEGTILHAAWGTWGTPPGDSGDAGAYFVFGVLMGTTEAGLPVHVTWVYTTTAQILPRDCTDPSPLPGIELPSGWSTVLYSESPAGFLRRDNIPPNAVWDTRTLCFFQCQGG